jgi:hypothetical protein
LRRQFQVERLSRSATADHTRDAKREDGPRRMRGSGPHIREESGHAADESTSQPAAAAASPKLGV